MLEAIFGRYSGGCVMVLAKKEDKVSFRGSGFLIEASGYYVTAAHVINLTEELVVSPYPQSGTSFQPLTLEKVSTLPVQVAQFDAIHDIALLRSTLPISAQVPPNILGTSETLSVGAPVAYLGFPFAHLNLHTLSISSGIVSAKVLTKEGVKKLQIDNMCHDGNSGGPLISAETGSIVGMITGRFNPMQGGAQIVAGGKILGAETNLSFAVSEMHIRDVLGSEGLNVK